MAKPSLMKMTCPHRSAVISAASAGPQSAVAKGQVCFLFGVTGIGENMMEVMGNASQKNTRSHTPLSDRQTPGREPHALDGKACEGRQCCRPKPEQQRKQKEQPWAGPTNASLH